MPTTPGGRYSPGDSEDWDLTTDLAAMQVSNESATATQISTAISSLARTAARAGTNTERLALSGLDLFEGLVFYTTDTDRRWFYNGTSWDAADFGSYLIRPSSVSGGTVAADGSISAGSSGTSIVVNGVFSSRFRRYEIRGTLTTPTNSYAALQMANAGSPATGSIYAYQDVVLNGAGNTASFNGSGANLPIGRNLGTEHYFHVELQNPGTATRTMVTASTSAYIAGFTQGGGYVNNSTAYDGFALLVPGTTAIANGSFSVYGLI